MSITFSIGSVVLRSCVARFCNAAPSAWRLSAASIDFIDPINEGSFWSWGGPGFCAAIWGHVRSWGGTTCVRFKDGKWDREIGGGVGGPCWVFGLRVLAARRYWYSGVPWVICGVFTPSICTDRWVRRLFFAVLSRVRFSAFNACRWTSAQIAGSWSTVELSAWLCISPVGRCSGIFYLFYTLLVNQYLPEMWPRRLEISVESVP
jgi:hypothetical protein